MAAPTTPEVRRARVGADVAAEVDLAAVLAEAGLGADAVVETDAGPESMRFTGKLITRSVRNANATTRQV